MSMKEVARNSLILRNDVKFQEFLRGRIYGDFVKLSGKIEILYQESISMKEVARHSPITRIDVRFQEFPRGNDREFFGRRYFEEEHHASCVASIISKIEV